jgi:hypothetical protein
MVKHKNIGLVALIAVIMVSASFASILLGATVVPEEKSVARTEAAIAFTIIGPTFTSNKYSDILSAGEEISYSVSLASSSVYSLSQLDITWQLETDWNTSVNVSGSTLTWYYNYEATRDITVVVAEKANNANQSLETISVQIIADLDEDGLPDLWERGFFGTTASSDGTTDYDNDGWTDLEEYQNGTDPTVSNPKPGFLETYSWLVALLAIIIVVVVLMVFLVMPKMKTQREADEKKKIAAAVEVEKSLLGLDELEDKPKK